jgi:hypothetical protein
MNLGQLIGELRMRAESAAEAAQPSTRKRKARVGHNGRQVLGVLAGIPAPLKAAEIATRANLPLQVACHALESLWHAELVLRFGARGSYCYRLPEAAA